MQYKARDPFRLIVILSIRSVKQTVEEVYGGGGRGRGEGGTQDKTDGQTKVTKILKQICKH